MSYEPGNWKAYCDICGHAFKATELQLDWRGFRVCDKDLDRRNPQDFIRPVSEKIAPEWTRPTDGGSYEETVTENASPLIVESVFTMSEKTLWVNYPSGATAIALPDANAARWLGQQVVLTIHNVGSINDAVVSHATNAIVFFDGATAHGSELATHINPNTTAQFVNGPNIWRRIK